MNYLNSIKKAALYVALVISPISVQAENILILGDGINLHASNEKEVNSDKLFSNSTQYKLPNGLNQILVSYTAEIQKGSDLEIEESNTFVLLFESHDSKLTLEAPEVKRLRDINRFEQIKNWSLHNGNGEAVKYKVDLIKKGGFQLSRDYEDELEEYNNSNAVAALPKKIINAPKPRSIKQEAPQESPANHRKNMELEMLIYWYNQADAKTRKSFKELINK
ncbi:DUF2057 domain-containing protein [Neptuniibacter sp.]|uniref:YccT family protein n=1 Tax=Neptuniibacter sp. TaxID=1962643 RepID=UPI00261BAE09|nr:DUF2057 domain-containing protein [Neptuniibacter sp.]MCP4594978.1 DUF2057 domain-containing protein [Neptuniibacter sp.]